MVLDFATVYDREVFNVYGFFAYRLKSRADVEDLTQQTFERALKAWSRYDPARGAVSTWLFAIARNLLVDHYRRDRSSTQTSMDADPATERLMPSIAGPEMALGISPDLATALAVLSDRDREVLALRFGGDLTGPEIAELLDLSLANIQQILSRALRRLRSELDPGRVRT
jgi:RNA polymerase sigma factor (sigma-70 family)